jgi:hypothetical protein
MNSFLKSGRNPINEPAAVGEEDRHAAEDHLWIDEARRFV